MFGAKGFAAAFFGEGDGVLSAIVRGVGGTPINRDMLDRLERRWVQMVDATEDDKRRNRLDRAAEEEDALILSMMGLL